MRELSNLSMVLVLVLSTIAGIIAQVSSFPPANAEANCEKATPNMNSADNWRGNVKQCSSDIEGAEDSKEPIRSCESPNRFKDNNNDGNEICKVRGSNSPDQ